MGVGGQCHALAGLAPGQTRYQLYKRLGGPQDWSLWVQKILPPLEFNHQTIQPVAGCCTVYAVPAHRGSDIDQ